MNEVGCLYTEAYLTNDQLGYDQNWTIADNFNNSDFNATGAAVENATFLRQCVIRGYQFDSFNTSQPKVYFIRKVTENVRLIPPQTNYKTTDIHTVCLIRDAL